MAMHSAGLSITLTQLWDLLSSVGVQVRLPGGHVVHTVNKCEWQTIALKTPDTAPEAEQKNLVSLMSFPVADQFFFCETYDTTPPAH